MPFTLNHCGKLDEAVEALPECVQGAVTAACYVLGFGGLSPPLFATALLYQAAQDGVKTGAEDEEAVTEDKIAKGWSALGKVLETCSQATSGHACVLRADKITPNVGFCPVGVDVAV